MDEATFDEMPNGRNPASEGWFVLNLADAAAFRNEEKGGAVLPLEPRGGPFTDFGVNVHVVWPGEPSALYHSESVREAFLVLSGECTLVVEEQERPLRRWDFFHCPAGTRHIFVGAGNGPCAVLAVGTRSGGQTIYPVSELALRHRAGVARETRDPSKAYADIADDVETRYQDGWLPDY